MYGDQNLIFLSWKYFLTPDKERREKRRKKTLKVERSKFNFVLYKKHFLPDESNFFWSEKRFCIRLWGDTVFLFQKKGGIIFV